MILFLYHVIKQITETKVEMKDEILPQLFVHTINEIPAVKAFVRKVADEKTCSNWKIEFVVPVVCKK